MSNTASIAQTAAGALREIADKLEALDPMASGPVVSVFVQPRGGALADHVALVDAISVALFGKGAAPGTHALTTDPGTWHHSAYGHIAPVGVSVFCSVTPPRKTIPARAWRAPRVTSTIPFARVPRVRRVGDHLIVARHGRRRSTAVLGAHGWNVCWRDAGHHLRWRTLSTVDAAVAYTTARVLGAVPA